MAALLPGAYDNLGLEPVWRTHQTVLVSDGSGPFNFRASPTPWSHLPRYAAIQGAQVWAVRKA
jgi:NTE family protein